MSYHPLEIENRKTYIKSTITDFNNFDIVILKSINRLKMNIQIVILRYASRHQI